MSAPFDIDPHALVHVDDPSFPGAEAVSATGAVLGAPPPAGTPWRYEAVPRVDHWPATEAIEALDADDWHDAGYTGEGVKVAVFDLQWFGAELDPEVLGPVETHDCWASVTCSVPMETWRPRFGFETGVHGYACAQVVRDVAPGVELHLVRVNGETTLENAVDWAIREGVDVISMSLSFFNTSFYDGTGRVNDHIDRLEAAGVLMVVSSGNYARSHWMGAWTDGNGDGRLDGDGDDGLWVYLAEGDARGLYVQWNQYRSCGMTDFDAYLRAEDGTVVGRSEDVQEVGADRCEPFERVVGYVERTGWYHLELVHRRGPTAFVEVKVLATDGSFASPVPEGSVTDPGSAEPSFTVGAVRAEEYLLNDIESFSSRGPTSDGRAKPDIAGPDGVTTEAYGPQGFFGTSAATPAVAGAIAVLMSSDPTLDAYAASERLQELALSDDATFELPDPRFGAGKAHLPDPTPAESMPCGHRPLVMPLFLLPAALLRRRRR